MFNDPTDAINIARRKTFVATVMSPDEITEATGEYRRVLSTDGEGHLWKHLASIAQAAQSFNSDPKQCYDTNGPAKWVALMLDQMLDTDDYSIWATDYRTVPLTMALLRAKVDSDIEDANEIRVDDPEYKGLGDWEQNLINDFFAISDFRRWKLIQGSLDKANQAIQDDFYNMACGFGDGESVAQAVAKAFNDAAGSWLNEWEPAKAA